MPSSFNDYIQDHLRLMLSFSGMSSEPEQVLRVRLPPVTHQVTNPNRKVAAHFEPNLDRYRARTADCWSGTKRTTIKRPDA